MTKFRSRLEIWARSRSRRLRSRLHHCHQCPPWRLDWFKLRLYCHWNTYKEIQSYNHRIK